MSKPIHDPPLAPDYGPHGGNIDLNDRPAVRNPRGGVSSVYSATITADGKAYLIPTVIGTREKGGRIVSKQAAIQHFQKTGQHLGVFKTEKEAGAYSIALHKEQAARMP